MTAILGWAAFAGFALSLVAHLLALLGVDVADRMPAVWLLHVGIFVVFVPVVFSSRKAFGPHPSTSRLRAEFPRWVAVFGTCLFIYAVVNFILFIVAGGGGGPSIRDGRFVLESHGHLIRELSAAEYTAYRANEVRGFSGHWLMFYFAAFAYFTCRRPEVRSSLPGN